MRCAACNKVLSDYESTMKSSVTGQYLDLCTTCYKTVAAAVPAKGRIELLHNEDSDSVALEDQEWDDWDE